MPSYTRGLWISVACVALVGLAWSTRLARGVDEPDASLRVAAVPAADAPAASEPSLHVYNSSLARVHFAANGIAALAFGSEGTTLRSIDDGQTWQAIDVPTRQSLVASVTDPHSGAIVVVGARGTILRSADAGQSFALTPLSTEQSLRAISVSADGKAILTVGDGGSAYVSHDGGRTFIAEQTPRADYLAQVVAVPGRNRFVVAGDNGTILLRDEGSGWREVSAIDKEAGLVMALAVLPGGRLLAATQAGWILSSDDDGERWKRVHDAGASSFVTGFTSDPVGSQVVARTRRGDLLLATDGGATFRSLSVGSKPNVAWMRWLNGHGFIGVTDDGGSLRSDLAAERWFRRVEPAFDDGPLDMAVHPVTGTVLVVGRAGLIARSTDHGLHYQAVRPSLGGSLRVLADNSAAGCLMGAGMAATVIRSLDSGKSWQRVHLALDDRVELNSIVVEPKSRAVIVGGSAGTLLRSDDCGRSWSLISGATTDVSFLQVGEASTVLALPARAAVLRSTNAGKSFAPSKMPADVTLKRTLAISPRDWIAVGDAGRIFRSADDGETFEAVVSGTDANLRALAYDRASRTLWAAGDRATVLRSSDDGSTWKRIPVPGEENLFAIGLNPDGGAIWLGGNGGTVLRSTDVEHFTSVPSGSTQTIRVIVFDPASGQFVLAGAGGTLLRTVDGVHVAKVKAPLEGRIDSVLFQASSGALFLGGERLVRWGGY